MSDSSFTVPQPLAFPSPQAAALLGAGPSMPLRQPQAGEQIALGGPPVSEAPPLVREVIEGRPVRCIEAVAEQSPLLDPDRLEADLDSVLAQLVQEVGASVRFDTTIPTTQATAKIHRLIGLIECLNGVRARLQVPSLLVPGQLASRPA